MTVIEEITNKSAALPVELQREVLDFVEFVARKRKTGETETSGDADDSLKSLRWLDENRRAYLGKWVALDGDKLIADGAAAKEVYQAASAASVRVPFVELVTEAETPPFCGSWQ